MRISDWSSDVCSSDLGVEERRQLARDLVGDRPQVAGRHHDVFGERAVAVHADADGVRAQVLLAGAAVAAVAADDMALGRNPLADRVAAHAWSDLDDAADEFMADHQPGLDRALAPLVPRSEEHTSELQSLMRISYAVFCLKKKKHKQIEKTLQTPQQ